ncbi:MAG: hypothetical protein CME88_04260 [Hirschia sp.]|nr:hypothetical protein [Hirschia sp.]MBF17573.1 hypothetical protein [Hirschia sp.]|tara:strand:+ start:87 stop:593 length:507 start_codon:yes stop_codon:yes gene_type:complete
MWRYSLIAVAAMIAAACSHNGADDADIVPEPTATSQGDDASIVEPVAPPETDPETDPGMDEAADGQKTFEELRAESLAKIDKEACAAKNGEIRQEGMLGLFRCTVAYSDGGKTCSDSSDCEGECRDADNTDHQAAPGTVVGKCQPTDSPFGCFTRIEGGQTTGTLCVD